MSEKSESYIVNSNRVFEDNEGIYFEKRETTAPHKLLGKIRPSELGFHKTETAKIYVFKEIQSTENLDNETVFFEMLLTFAIPEGEEKKYKTQYFYKAQSGKVFLRDFESGVCSECSINSEFVKRGRAKKLEPDSRIAKNAPIFKINSSGELEREINQNTIW